MGLEKELPDESLRKIKKALYSCKTVEQVGTVLSWVSRLRLSNDLAHNRALFEASEDAGKVLIQYIQYQNDAKSLVLV